jgi:type I restriction enzyme, S subunit
MGEWINIKVKELCHIGRGRVINQNEINNKPGIYPVYSSQSMNKGEMGRIETYDFDGEYVTWTTDGAYAGTVFHRIGKFNCTNVCGTLKAKKDNNLDLLFLSYLLSTKSKKHVSYIGNPKLMNGIMGEIELYLPIHKPEQTRIAQILSTADQAIAQTEALIAKYQHIKTGMMQDLLTRGIDQHGNIRNKTTHKFIVKNGMEVPEEWVVVELSSLGSIVTGSTPPVKQDENYGEEFQFITPADLSDSQYIFNTERKLSQTGFKRSRHLPKDSICVVCIGSTIGKLSMTCQLSTSNQQINSLIPDDNDLAHFYFYSMTIHLESQLRKQAGLQAVPIVNKNSFSKMKIPVPKQKEEAVIILGYLNESQKVFETYQKNLSKLHSLKSGLMQDLLSGKIRVTLNGRI